MAAEGLGSVAVFDHVRVDNDNHSDREGQTRSNVTGVQSLPIPEPLLRNLPDSGKGPKHEFPKSADEARVLNACHVGRPLARGSLRSSCRGFFMRHLLNPALSPQA